ncbi:putative PEP-binding protein [Propionibacteriaceae bacterium G57]|uniref:putative PEP-binding protein n=1 Tax=Aestuariimicrobium sp. G57 TaxID=3418485 RepID=UPI003DA7231D
MAASVAGQVDEADALVFEWTIQNPHGLHARPAAALVRSLRDVDAIVRVANATTGAGPVPATSMSKVATLGLRKDDVLRATLSGPEAPRALTNLTRLAEAGFGEDVSDPHAGEIVPPAPVVAAGGADVPQRSGTQVVIGAAFVTGGEVDTSDYVQGPDERARLRTAITVVRARLSNPDDMILMMQAALLDDPALVDPLTDAVLAGKAATAAVDEVYTRVAAEFAALPDPYQAERAQDVRSLRRLLLAELMGRAPEALPTGEHVLVVPELDAATAAQLDPSACLGVVTTTGGATGHGVIIATGRGIPVLTGRGDAAGVVPGEVVAFDPVGAQLWVNPDEATLDQVRATAAAREVEEAEAAEQAHVPAVSPGGRVITVEANVGSLEDAVRGAAAGAEGSGLVRTELLFGHQQVAPTAEEQAAVLVEIGQALAPHPITVRTWDVGGDKPLPFLPQDKELNPFLGERGLRTMRRVPEFFDEQLRGIALASKQVPVRLMFPMVTEPEEMAWARDRALAAIEAVGAEPFQIGMMVEVPAAALRAAEFAGLVDFVSIGTNDLTQYTTATDRSNGTVSKLAKSDSPGVLELMRLTCERLPGVTVAVCGDLASKPDMVATLVEMGITELSCRPPLVGQVKQAVRRG